MDNKKGPDVFYYTQARKSTAGITVVVLIPIVFLWITGDNR
jgi:hypothetical protein